MNAWTLALGNVERAAASRGTATQRVYQAGMCQWCGTVLPSNRSKFCGPDCTSRHHNIMRATTRAGRKP